MELSPAAVRLEDHGDGVLEIALDDAAHRNQLTTALCDALEAALAQVAARADAKVVLLTGRPEVFCGGAPIEVLEALASGRSGLHVRDLALPDRLLALPVPLVAALEGPAVGGGLALALCCDMRVAASSRRYGLNFTDLGFTPGMGTTALLPALVGHALASEMLLTGKLYKGQELAGCGLFNAVVAPEAVRATALALARRIAEKPRHVIELLKRTLNAPRRQALQAALAQEHLMHQLCFARPETHEAIQAHYQGPPPQPPERSPA